MTILSTYNAQAVISSKRQAPILTSYNPQNITVNSSQDLFQTKVTHIYKIAIEQSDLDRLEYDLNEAKHMRDFLRTNRESYEEYQKYKLWLTLKE